MAGRRTSTQEMMARLEVIEEEDAVTRSSVEGVHNKTSASAKATLAKTDKTLQEMQLEIAASRVGQDALDVKMAETAEREKDLMDWPRSSALTPRKREKTFTLGPRATASLDNLPREHFSHLSTETVTALLGPYSDTDLTLLNSIQLI